MKEGDKLYCIKEFNYVDYFGCGISSGPIDRKFEKGKFYEVCIINLKENSVFIENNDNSKRHWTYNVHWFMIKNKKVFWFKWFQKWYDRFYNPHKPWYGEYFIDLKEYRKLKLEKLKLNNNEDW